jgi:cytochrome c oxidase assembly protein subunit 11
MTAPRQPRQHRRTFLALAGIVLGMGALAWAAVPLYDLFCRVTGYAGTPLVASAGAASGGDRVLDRTVSVRFDASTAGGMPWRFRPARNTVEVHPGETNLAFYEASNPTDRAITGTATFNVSPPAVGGYFVKIDCFCFQEQTLAPGESVQMPVTFYVDPAIADDAETRGIGTITLSYTFFETELQTEPQSGTDDGAGLAATPATSPDAAPAGG